jgi:glutamate dehydrogenase/leucine dehydrogenase
LAIGGSLGRAEATGRGLTFTVREAAKKLAIDLKQATVAIQGFGNAGQYAGQLLEDLGAKVVAVSDTKAAVFNKSGLNVESLRNHKEKNGSVSGFPDTKTISGEEIIETECTILIPAALENQITHKNASKISAKIVAEAANGPTTPEADETLFKNKVLLIPDILANGGGVTVSYFEWLQNLRREYWTEPDVNDRLDRNISKAFADVYQTHEKHGVNMRKASTLLAIEKVADATRLRGLWP